MGGGGARGGAGGELSDSNDVAKGGRTGREFRLGPITCGGKQAKEQQVKVDVVYKASGAGAPPRALPADRFPRLRGSAGPFVEAMGGDAAFDYGLERLLDGIEAQLPPGG